MTVDGSENSGLHGRPPSPRVSPALTTRSPRLQPPLIRPAVDHRPSVESVLLSERSAIQIGPLSTNYFSNITPPIKIIICAVKLLFTVCDF